MNLNTRSIGLAVLLLLLVIYWSLSAPRMLSALSRAAAGSRSASARMRCCSICRSAAARAARAFRSSDVSVKRLAMETEPHPMDYNQFEGVIPEGAYGGGTVMIWDKGVWAPIAENRLGDEREADRQLAKGELKFVLLGKKLKGSWVLVRTRGTRQWLLIKHRDEYASGEDLTVTQRRSVVSGRTMAEIGRAAGASPRQL